LIPPDLTSERLILRAIDEADVGERYLSWMTDSAVVEFTESRFLTPRLEDLRRFVIDCRASSHSYMFAIVVKDTNEHVGNIKLGPINPHHGRGAVGIIIGEREAWGKGFATEAVMALSDWAFDSLALHKLIAGIYAVNLASVRAFERAGFVIEGRQIDDVLLADGTRGDTLLLGRVSP